MQFVAYPTPEDLFEAALLRYPELNAAFSGPDAQELRELAIQVLAKDHNVCERMLNQTRKINAIIRNILGHRRAQRLSDRMLGAKRGWVDDWVKLIMESQRSTVSDKPNIQVTGMSADCYRTVQDAECLARYLKKEHTASFVLVTDFKLKSTLNDAIDRFEQSKEN